MLPPKQKTVAGVAIVRGIPIPSAQANRRSALLEVLAALEPGESFLFKHACKDFRTHKSLAGRKFTARRVSENQFRIWRVS
jgi:hypothetical protein